MARIIDWLCRHVLRGAYDAQLFAVARQHVDEDQPAMKRTDERKREGPAWSTMS